MRVNEKLRAYSTVLLILLLTQSALIGIFSSIKPTGASASLYPVVKVYPDFIGVDVGESFTVAVVGLNLTNAKITPPGYTWPVWIGNLYGFDIQFTWNPEILQYVGHTVTCPVENYPGPNPPSPYGGALHKPVIPVKDVVNESGNIPDAAYNETRAWIAYASMYPAQPQNGNVTFFTITFRVLKTGSSPLKILRCDLAAEDGTPIYHIVEDGVYKTGGVPTADFNYWPSIPVVNKITYFTAIVSENKTNIKIYMWNFGDGAKQNSTQPTISHTYTERGVKNVGLKVVDENDVESAWVYKEILVAAKRDIEVQNIIFPTTLIKVDPLVPFSFSVVIANNGDVYENCTVYTYYNTSTVDLANPSLATWHLASSRNVTLKYGSTLPVKFEINTTKLAVNASYYVLANITTNIPEGYEENVNNNVMLSSEAFFVTNVTIHNIVITKLECVWCSGAVKAYPPLIEGEAVTVLLTMMNKGTEADVVFVEVFFNDTSVGNKTVSIAWAETKEEAVLQKEMLSGRYNVTVVVKAGDFNANKSTLLHVIKPPKINFTYSPTTVIKGQPITFNGSTTIHQDPEGNVTIYKWEFFAPGLDWSTANPTGTREGPITTYNFTSAGNWTIVLKIKDNFGLEYNAKRPATSAYILYMSLNVGEAVAEGGEGQEKPDYTIQYIIAIVIVIALIAAFSIYIRRRRLKAIEEAIEEEEEV